METENILPLQRSSQQRLRITFPDGKTICYRDAIHTFIATLIKIGSEKFPLIDLCTSGGRRLITQTVDSEDENFKVEICEGWWYINRHVNTDNKYIQLTSINNQLNLALKIEISADFESTQNKRSRTRKSKSLLKVEFGDGSIFGPGVIKDVFIDSIRHIGLQKISGKSINWLRQPLISATNIMGKRVEIAPYKWVMIPKDMKAAIKLLTIISSFTNTPLTATEQEKSKEKSPQKQMREVPFQPHFNPMDATLPNAIEDSPFSKQNATIIQLKLDL